MTEKEWKAEQAWRNAADNTPGVVCHAVATRALDKRTNYEVAKDLGDPEICLRRYACVHDAGPYVVSQLERDRKGQLYLHRYSVTYHCKPDGSSHKSIKRID